MDLASENDELRKRLSELEAENKRLNGLLTPEEVVKVEVKNAEVQVDPPKNSHMYSYLTIVKQLKEMDKNVKDYVSIKKIEYGDIAV